VAHELLDEVRWPAGLGAEPDISMKAGSPAP
jgi:hypothetical protein